MRVCRLLAMLILVGGLTMAQPIPVPTQIVQLKEYLGHAWMEELVSYPLGTDLEKAPALKVTDAAGKAVPFQVHQGRIYFLVTLPADGELTYTIQPQANASPPIEGARALPEIDGDAVMLDSGAIALRVQALFPRYPAAGVSASEVPGPLQGVRLGTGPWIGKSWLDAPLKVIAAKTTVTAHGPLFAEAMVDYTFEGGKHYTFTARVIARQSTAIIDETMDLNPGGAYKLLTYKDDVERSTWEWWAQDDTDHLGVETRRGHPANAVFSFYDGLEPNQCRWRGSQASQPRKGVDAQGKPWTAWGNYETEAYAPLTYELNEEFNRLTGWWVNSFADYSQYFAILREGDAAKPVISFTTGRPSRNINPTLVTPPQPWVKMVTATNDLRICTTTQKDLQVVAPICLGSREWLLTIEPQAALHPKGDPRMPAAFMTILKYGRYPLDKIKDWAFDWPEPKDAWPRLFCLAGDLVGMQARVGAASKPMQDHWMMSPIYKPGGTTEQEAKFAIETLGRVVKSSLGDDGFSGVNWFRISLDTIRMIPVWEAAMATPDLDPKTRARIKAYGAFIAHRIWDEDYWPEKEANLGWGSINMGTLACTGRVMAAMGMAGHPRFAAWTARSKAYLEGNLRPLISEDGAGISCPSYLGASLEPILYMALALKYGGDFDAFKDDPRLRKYGQFMIDILTPPDPRSPMGGPAEGLPMGAKLDPNAKNRVNMWPLGHTSRTQTTGILDILALGYAGVNNPLAGALRTMSARMDNPAGGAFVPAAMLCNRATPPAEPDLRSRWYPGYGAILRDGRPRETWFAYRQTKYAVDHFQYDQGAFSLFAKGAPLMLDWGSMYSPSTDQVVYHNRVGWDFQEGPLKPCPGNGKDGCFYKGMTYFEHTHEPWTSKAEFFGPGMAPQDAFGTIQRYASLPAGDYLQGRSEIQTLSIEPHLPDTAAAKKGDPNQLVHTTPANFAWERRVLFAKTLGEAGPVYFLIRDDFQDACPPPTASFWVMATDLKLEGNRARATGQFGVDMEFYIAQPVKPVLSAWQFEHKNWGGERQLCLRVSQPDGKPFLTVLYPRRPDEPMPTFTSLADGDGVKVALPGITDYAFLTPRTVNYRAGNIAFTGTAGYLRVTPNSAIAMLSDAGSVMLNGTILRSGAAASLAHDGKRLTVQTNGPTQTLTFSGRYPHRKIRLDGKPVRSTLRKGILTIVIPAGEHTLILE
ncbi:MAG: hypothetical protein BWY76_01271 [bacterium ADurb.Bin429]|nr:MAG: hypothetical protein BWY76_01271 [bacterium ADurb.Bin429]